MVLTKSYEAPPMRESEILRYAGYKIGNKVTDESTDVASKETVAPEIRALLDECLREVSGKLEYKVCYCELPVNVQGKVCDLGSLQVTSKNLAHFMGDSQKTILFAATIGVGIDRLITRYSSLSPAKALMFQAIGAERIEALCDAFCGELLGSYLEHKSQDSGVTKLRRFSPGYGDLPLETQKEIFAVLDCGKRIGLTLNDSLLMSPTKSVTAFVGDLL